MNIELPPQYNPKEHEEKIYKLWEESGFFSPEKTPHARAGTGTFVTAIAPPNITGELHMGHALELTMQDILVRMKRMQGYHTLWIPGIDHAGIAAQNVVEKKLRKEGLTRHDLGREKFEQQVQEWKEKYGIAILGQFKKLGISVDWTRTRYTRDEGYEKAVRAAFEKYRERGWIYKGFRVINWCVRCETGISDLETNYMPEKGKLYYIKYGPFMLATTRPETKLGDTALAVHPADVRYKNFIGKKLKIETIDNSVPSGETPRLKEIEIEIVADEAVDPEFGTGIVKVTPAHDLTDFEIGQRHSLPMIQVINEQGKMSKDAGVRFEGMKVLRAREQIVADMQNLGLLEKIEDYDHNIARCDRCDSVIEPLPSEQWFLKVKELANLAKEAITSGQTQILPKNWGDVALRWIENMKDWNISRQLWWGHKIPVEGEHDVLDTWFSSALWPFAVLGWPEDTADLKNYYPTQFITSDRGILFLWQVRMIFSGKFFTGRAPFEKIYIHPTVLTKEGKRMSKSLGTGIDPVGLIEKYGADALRFGLAYQNTGVQDMRFSEDTIMMGKKFANKIWNIARYVLMKTGQELDYGAVPLEFSLPITAKLKRVSIEMSEHINEYKFGQAAHLIYDFVWHDFADIFIEETKDKDDQKTKETLAFLLTSSLKLLHPFMPFITEAIWEKLRSKEKRLLMAEDWPAA